MLAALSLPVSRSVSAFLIEPGRSFRPGEDECEGGRISTRDRHAMPSVAVIVHRKEVIMSGYLLNRIIVIGVLVSPLAGAFSGAAVLGTTLLSQRHTDATPRSGTAS